MEFQNNFAFFNVFVKGNFEAIQKLLYLIRDNNLSPSLQTYAISLECLGRQKNLNTEATSELIKNIQKKVRASGTTSMFRCIVLIVFEDLLPVVKVRGNAGNAISSLVVLPLENTLVFPKAFS